MKIENDPGYIEGHWQGQKLAPDIIKTHYGTLENAIAIKQSLVNEFETQIRYSREMDIERFDYNYSFNVGFLDALLEYQESIIDEKSNTSDS